MDIKRFLTEASPPEAEWRAYPLLKKNEELWTPFNEIGMYELIGKILVIRDNVPNPCFTSHPYRAKQERIVHAIFREPNKYGIDLLSGENKKMKFNYLHLENLIELINEHP